MGTIRCPFQQNLTNHRYRFDRYNINLHVHEAMILAQACVEVEPDIVCEVLVFLQFLADDDEMRMTYCFVSSRHHLVCGRSALMWLRIRPCWYKLRLDGAEEAVVSSGVCFDVATRGHNEEL